MSAPGRRRRVTRVGGMDAAAAMRTVPAKAPEHGGYTFLQVIPNVEHAAARLEHALTVTSSLGELSADNECEHGGLPGDTRPQPGCSFGCPGYPRSLPDPAARQQPAPNGRAIGVQRVGDRLVQTILCACGRTWTRPAVRGRVPKCPDCKTPTLTKESS